MPFGCHQDQADNADARGYKRIFQGKLQSGFEGVRLEQRQDIKILLFFSYAFLLYITVPAAPVAASIISASQIIMLESSPVSGVPSLGSSFGTSPGSSDGSSVGLSDGRLLGYRQARLSVRLL